MKQHQTGVKFSIIVISVVLMGVSAWFNQANASEQAPVLQSQTE
ncbi:MULTISPECIES: hypothetical protein [Pseudoalteromonas]|uniref:Uncharacterized protein n=1 Tax=Pseudoalteromonas rhizosphaerae TaxID=2518973 RepID=A0ABW8KR88_9GAMM|nr:MULTISPECIES: hypothetical protein [Pseudoalteromonas]|tara:strand:+ start:2907 stop:3038 length:132 start_codon:yes stop_codon:yes gene_type:complete